MPCLLGEVARLLVRAHVEAEDDRLRGSASVTSDSVTPPTPPWMTRATTSSLPSFSTRGGDRLDRSLHVALDDERQFLASRRLEVAHHVGERRPDGGSARGELLAPLAFAIFRDFARARLRLDDGDAVARFRRAGESEHFDRRRGPGRLDVRALIVDQRPDAAPMRAGDDQLADAQRAALHQHGRHGAAAAIEPSLDDRAFRAAVGVGGKIEQLGLQRDRLEQLVEIDALGRRNFDSERIAAKRLHLHVVLQELLHHALGIGFGLVDFVDCDDDRSLGRLGVANRLDRLRHDAVVGRYDQHDDVGDLRAARAHRGEGCVAGRVDEGDFLAAGGDDLVGADVLGDAARFARDDVGVADRVEQRGLAVIDMAHDGDDRRARDGRAFVVGPIEQAFFDVGLGDALDRMAHLLGDQLRGVGVEHVGQGHHAALAHQKLDHVDCALGHAAREFLDRDRLRQNDLARDFFLLVLRAVTFQPLRAATERGDRTGALLLARGRAGDGQSATVALLSAARRPRRRDDDLLSRQDQRRTPGDPPPFILLAAGGAGERSGRGDPGRGLGRGAGIDGDGAGSPPERRLRASSSD